MTDREAFDHDWPSQFRGRVPDRNPYRFKLDENCAMQRLGIIGEGFELMGGIMLMRGSDVPVRLHSSDLQALYAAAIIPAEVRTEMIEGVIYHALPNVE